MKRLLSTPDSNEEIEVGQILDTPPMTIGKDKDGTSTSVPISIYHSRWAINSDSLEDQHLLSHLLEPQALESSPSKPQELVVQKKKIKLNPKDHDKMIDLNKFSQSPKTMDDFAMYRSIDNFEQLNKIEEGAYGIVFCAQDKQTGRVVALKKFKKVEKDEEETSMMEFEILSSLQHPSIVAVKEIVVNNDVPPTKFMVMEFVEHDLGNLMQNVMKNSFSQSEVKCLMLQLLEGVKYLHDNGVIHRDLKPSNLLLNNCGKLKICDFGMAQRFQSQPLDHVERIVTLPYRAPELLFGAKKYSTAIDMWSLGCIMAEFLSRDILFPGQSIDDQIIKICDVLGTPNKKIWPNFVNLVHVPSIMINQPFNKLREKFPSLAFIAKPTLTHKGFDLLNKLLTYDPLKRITVHEALNHEWFQEVPFPKEKVFMPTFPKRIVCV